MEFVANLWMPIGVSAIALFFFSAAAWMLSPHHKNDYRSLPAEDTAMDELRKFKLSPGRYMFPFAGRHKDGQDPEFQQKWEKGPVGVITIFGQVNMGRNMGLTFVFFLVVSLMLAYLGWVAFEGEPYSFMRIFRVMGMAGILAYAAGGIPNDIWFRRPLISNLVDGIVYGLVSGLIFAALWPQV